ncbi:MAG: hypothetical protein HUU48_02470 [Flavobacteriales bacterium]|nr:hypothetical protein [Flavobacteriales bacterium]
MKKTLVLFAFAFIGLSASYDLKFQRKRNKQTTITGDKNNVEYAKNITDTIVYDTLIFPKKKEYTIKILPQSTFHGNEVWENAENEVWWGLFNGKKGWYISKTEIKLHKVYDPIFDADDEKTGSKIISNNSDNCILLFVKNSYIKGRKVQKENLAKDYIYPGDTLKFWYKAVHYEITATGGKRKPEYSADFFEVWNYKLYISANIKGRIKKSLLVAQPNFNNQLTYLLFAGDIDGDNILDLIINTSRHYNVSSPTLYLSKPADKDGLLVPVGMHTSMGC